MVPLESPRKFKTPMKRHSVAIALPNQGSARDLIRKQSAESRDPSQWIPYRRQSAREEDALRSNASSLYTHSYGYTLNPVEKLNRDLKGSKISRTQRHRPQAKLKPSHLNSEHKIPPAVPLSVLDRHPSPIKPIPSAQEMHQALFRH